DIENAEEYLEKAFSYTKGKKVMLGVYLWDYGGQKDMDPALFEMQIKRYFELLCDKTIEGVIFCSNTLGDAPLETNRVLKEYVRKYGDTEIE
ncbi:MAG: hypothetical protein IJ939_00070, partial [Clostridia bacterium]|nr:hypothetical protein [Clostridia bacterium]